MWISDGAQVGASADGGYFGADAVTFYSAVQSGAAGTYVLDAIAASPGFRTTLAISSGQTVAAAGVHQERSRDTIAWGDSAGFTVGQRGSLSLTDLLIAGDVSVAGGGELTLDGCLLAEGLALDVAADGAADLTDVVFRNQARVLIVTS